MYEAGEGIKANPIMAAGLYAQAAAAGDTFGALKLQELEAKGFNPAPGPAPEVSSLPNGLDMLVLEPGDIEQPKTLRAI